MGSTSTHPPVQPPASLVLRTVKDVRTPQGTVLLVLQVLSSTWILQTINATEDVTQMNIGQTLILVNLVSQIVKLALTVQEYARSVL